MHVTSQVCIYITYTVLHAIVTLRPNMKQIKRKKMCSPYTTKVFLDHKRPTAPGAWTSTPEGIALTPSSVQRSILQDCFSKL